MPKDQNYRLEIKNKEWEERKKQRNISTQLKWKEIFNEITIVDLQNTLKLHTIIA